MAVFLALALLRLWRLPEAPPNVTGDEVTFLNDVLRILHAPGGVSPTSLMGDGSQSGISLYFMAMVASLFPEEDGVLAMRVASSVLSIAALGAFYLYLRARFSAGPSLGAMFLLGTNYVFLNMSRATWMADGKGLGLACGLLSFMAVERAVESGRAGGSEASLSALPKPLSHTGWGVGSPSPHRTRGQREGPGLPDTERRRQRWRLAVLGGALGGLALYGYLGTALLPLASLAYLAWAALGRRIEWKLALKYGALFSAAALIVFLPNLLTILQEYERYTLRSRAVFVGSMEEAYYRDKGALGIGLHQVGQTARGFLLLDPAVGGKGTENGRYVPVGEAPVDAATRVLFLGGLAVVLLGALRKAGARGEAGVFQGQGTVSVSAVGQGHPMNWPCKSAPYRLLQRPLCFSRGVLVQSGLGFVIVLVFTQLLTVLPPNYARGIYGLVFIHMVVAALLERAWSLRLWQPVGRVAVVLLVAAIGVWNVGHYFEWSSGSRLASERQPAIEYMQVGLWVEVEKRRIAEGRPDLVITSAEWQELARGVGTGAYSVGAPDGPASGP